MEKAAEVLIHLMVENVMEGAKLSIKAVNLRCFNL